MALAAATNVTTPVAVFRVYVPSPAISTTPSASHSVVFGVYKHVTEAFSDTGDDPKPPAPVTVVNNTVPPGNTALVSDAAVGADGFDTVGVIVAVTC